MPEGDTVWNTARLLHGALAGQVIDHSDFRVPSLATVELTGWRVRECVSRGKHILMRLGHPHDSRRLTLRTHLRMDGTWRVYAVGERWRGRPAHLIRIVLRTPSAVAVGYHLHEIALVSTEEEEALLAHLGPDLLGEPDLPGGWNAEEAVGRLRSHPDRAIAEALLEQRNLAGIGNLYKAEVLFLRGISPWTPVSAIPELEAVVALARELLLAHRGRWRQITTGSSRRGEEVYVYGRAGLPCRRCGTRIKGESQGDRVTYWCPTCQPARD